ncbi:rhodanese-like domain-containing protein [Limosilactobacillus panis]|uniref:Rhodanese-like domain-containing protein n=1 Tax=Limosilactobacillus panis TaxID=47493 RepID=A0ABT7VK25_9LACO|nr:rhodanese-like domain-containing protein [Limosilactobacillus panis]MDM8333104.1 rhodanese-like domain-containing protein [Limosilactobacillus panis]HJA22282.1 rhodanese-like domain-containing protein [Candidatus Limosilactobacillus intestinipullorum]
MVLGISNGLLAVNIVVIVIILVWLISWGWGYWRRNHYATVLDQEDFQKGLRKAQVIDLRQEKDFAAGHILGARNLPYIYLRQQYGELRPDLPVYLYDDSMTLSTQAAAFLSKHGYDKLYILRNGYREWDGKTKKNKY